jgi:YaiO family outer membrane protein
MTVRKHLILLVLSMVIGKVYAQSSTPEITLHPQLSYTQSFLTLGFDPWQMSSVDLQIKKAGKWTITPGITHYHRFGEDGWSLSADNYAFISDRLYVNAQVKVHSGVFLPVWDYSVSLYRNIGKFEISAGLKQLHYVNTITIIPASIGIYMGNYWVSFQNFSGKENGTRRYTQANLITSRRYFDTANQYVELKVGKGQELNMIGEGDQVSMIFNHLVSLGYHHPIKQRTIGLHTSLVREEIRQATFRYRTEITLIFK